MANRDLLTASLLASVFWNLCGFAIRSFDRLWPAGPLPVTPISAVLTAGTAIGVPLSRSRQRRAVRAVTGIGVLSTLWSLAGMATLQTPRVKIGPAPGILAPGLAAVFGIATTIFGIRTLRD